ncbi:hypothetical protein PHMEG_00020816 [Phytophthora megakarya]|uniref:Uncharacterized protein n=1 Tax=Phytophthora megakarya TaxID=4795 RepID=A0A225VP43_9STRA|nr:hypothetical protein PHMEG_00020816 [Phytophthora megakarya]
MDLMNWIWENSRMDQKSRPNWSLCNFLQSDKQYYQWQFSKCLEYAAKRGDLVRVKWLFDHFKECEVPHHVIYAAAETGQLAVLKFLLNHDYGVYGAKIDSPEVKKRKVESEIDVQSRITVKWGSRNVEHALCNEHPEVAQWFYKHVPKGEYDHGDDRIRNLISGALDAGADEFAEALVPQGSNILDFAMDCNRLEVIERLVDGGYFVRDDFNAARSIEALVRADRLDLMKRISTQQNFPPDHAVHWESHWFYAMSNACHTGNVSILRWLIEHPLGRILLKVEKRSKKLNGLILRAAEGGHTDVMEYLHDEGIITEYKYALLLAIRKNQLGSVKWLVQHFPQSEIIPDYCIMDEAAKFGRIEILEYLQSLDASIIPGWAPIHTSRNGETGQTALATIRVSPTDANLKVYKGAVQCQATWLPTDPMDHASANGHFDLVKWFDSNRPEGCTTAAIDAAAANGHFEIVQWLRVNGKRGFTTKAMDGAASNGNLEMVKWLHENGGAGCTKAAMDRAASNGYLQMLKWLYTNRSEGCTINALEGALGRGHLHVVCWLQMHYPQYSPSNMDIEVFTDNKFEIFLFVHIHYAYILTRTFVQDILGDDMRGNPNGNDAYIFNWLQEKYVEE